MKLHAWAHQTQAVEMEMEMEMEIRVLRQCLSALAA